MKENRVILLVLLFCCLAASCSDDDGSVGAGNAYRSPIPTAWSKVDWTDFYPDFTYKGFAPSCTHCPMDDCDPQFYFYAKGGTVNDLLVFFEGGGACWHTSNCIYVSTTNTRVEMTLSDLEEQEGIGDLENPENPFRDWNIVYIPYCTGDVHSGANDYDYPDDLGFHLLPDFNHFTIRHRGKVNARVVLQWMQDTFTKTPDRIFVAGSSAGAYGALLNFPDIRDAFPASTVYCFPDAGNGIMPDSDAVFKDLAQERWNFQLPWQVEGFEEGVTDFRDFTTGQMVAAIANHYPDSVLASYTSAWDHNQIAFYYIMLHIDYLNMALNWINYWENVDAYANEWNRKMYAIRDEAIAENTAGNIRYFISGGCNHTILGDPAFYTEVTNGYTVAQWVTRMLESGSAGLPQVACTGCSIKPDYLAEDNPCE